MCVIAVVMLYPFFYMLDNAFRNQSQFARESGHSSVSWGQLFTELPVWRELLNSTLICTISILLILAVSTTAGFAFAKLRYRGSGLVFLGVVAALMVPLQSIIIPEYVNLGKLGLINTYLGAILVYVALGTPFATFLMATYYRGISDDLIEAAVMDGPDLGWDVAVPAGAELGERPFWDSGQACLMWVDITAGRLHRYRPGAGDEIVLDLAGVALGAAAPRRGGGYVLATAAGFRLTGPLGWGGGVGASRARGGGVGASRVQLEQGALRPPGMPADA